MKYVFNKEGERINSTPSLPPGIVSYNFPYDLATNIVNFAKNSPEDIWIDSSVLGIEGKQSIRTSMDCNFDYNFPRIYVDHTNAIIDQCVSLYNDEFPFAGVQQREPLGMLRYGPGKSYDVHCDSHWKLYRVLSMLIYLNPHEYEGGETFFPYFDLHIKPEEPAIVFFPSNYIYCHQALPVNNGEKMVLVNWMNDLPKPLHQESMDKLHQSIS